MGYCVGLKKRWSFGRSMLMSGSNFVVCFDAKNRKDAIKKVVKNLKVWGSKYSEVKY